MKTLKKIYDGIVEVEGWIAVVALVAAIVLNAYEILQRNLWGNSFIWIQEISVLSVSYTHLTLPTNLFV